MVAASPAVRYVASRRAGLDFARNRALAEASGEMLAFVDDDVGGRAGLGGRRSAAALAADPEAGGCTGLVLPVELAHRGAGARSSVAAGSGAACEPLRLAGARRRRGTALYPFGAGIFGAGCNMAFRRAVLEELGGFDEALDTGRPLPGGGDLDMFFRVVRAGRPIALRADAPWCATSTAATTRACAASTGRGAPGFMAFLSKCGRASRRTARTIARLVALVVRATRPRWSVPRRARATTG